MKEYTRGILFTIGNKSKEKGFTIQTSNESKLYFMEKVRQDICPDKEIRHTKRMLRGKEMDLYILCFSNKDVLSELEETGYTGSRCATNKVTLEFLTAVIEITAIKTPDGYIRLIGSEEWVNFIQEQIHEQFGLLNKMPILHNKVNRCVQYSKVEFMILASKLMDIADRNVSWWEDMIAYCLE